MRIQFFKYSVAILLLAIHIEAASQTLDARNLLTTVINTSNKASSLVSEYTATIRTQGNAEQLFEFKTTEKGEKLLLTFSAPQNQTNNIALQQSFDNIYVYTKDIGRVRTLSATAVNAAFVLPVSINELRIIKWLSMYTADSAKQLSNTSQQLFLTVNAVNAASGFFSRLIVTIDKTIQLPTEILCYNNSGKLLRKFNFSNYTLQGNAFVSKNWMVTLYNNVETICQFTTKKVEVNIPIDEDTFSQRNLTRGGL